MPPFGAVPDASASEVVPHLVALDDASPALCSGSPVSAPDPSMTPHAMPTDALHGWVRELFEVLGCEPDEARLTADHLVGANLAGHDSHGVGMVPLYVESCLAGFLRPNRTIELVTDTGALLVVDGGAGMGQSVAHQAMTLAIERAREHGIALLGLRNAHHIGRVGHWAEMAIDAGLVAIHFSNAMARTPVVAPHGGAEARFLTNPFTVGIPRADGEPILLDFATSAIAHGKARVAMSAGAAVPDGTVIDARGQPTTDPRVLFEEPGGALRTFAGHKGHALAMVCELLGAAMTGGVTGRPAHLPEVPGVINNMLAIVFDPERLGTGASFEREASAFVEWVRSAALDELGEALGGILMPGDPERLSRVARAAHVPLDAGTLAELARAARLVDEHRAPGGGRAPLVDPHELLESVGDVPAGS